MTTDRGTPSRITASTPRRNTAATMAQQNRGRGGSRGNRSRRTTNRGRPYYRRPLIQNTDAPDFNPAWEHDDGDAYGLDDLPLDFGEY